MNIFRICGDMVHLLSIFIILVKITTQRNCAGNGDQMIWFFFTEKISFKKK